MNDNIEKAKRELEVLKEEKKELRKDLRANEKRTKELKEAINVLESLGDD